MRERGMPPKGPAGATEASKAGGSKKLSDTREESEAAGQALRRAPPRRVPPPRPFSSLSLTLLLRARLFRPPPVAPLLPSPAVFPPPLPSPSIPTPSPRSRVLPFPHAHPSLPLPVPLSPSPSALPLLLFLSPMLLRLACHRRLAPPREVRRRDRLDARIRTQARPAAFSTPSPSTSLPPRLRQRPWVGETLGRSIPNNTPKLGPAPSPLRPNLYQHVPAAPATRSLPSLNHTSQPLFPTTPPCRPCMFG
jgi:hypothetical protein